MYIVEWIDHAGDRHQLAFDNKAAAEREAERLSEAFGELKVAVVAETDI